MTDRELLELAAKAAGYEIKVSEVDGTTLYTRDSSVGWRIWNPRDDDGDALRLAVKLHIGIKSNGPDHWQEPNTSVAMYEIGDFGGRVMVRHGDGPPQKATRRAIVRAAAEIGRNMK